MKIEDQVKIKRIIANIDQKKTYVTDIDDSNTLYEFRRIISFTAHLLKNNIKIFFDSKEITKEYDETTLHDFFGELDPIQINIDSCENVNDSEDNYFSIDLNLNTLCPIHSKNEILYCLLCQKSICYDCNQELHSDHKVEEKIDYLAPSKTIIGKIFPNCFKNTDERFEELMNFRKNIKLNIFTNIQRMLKDLEAKCESCLSNYSLKIETIKNNIESNYGLLKDYCIEHFIKYKNNINTRDIMIKEGIYKDLSKKVREIELYKREYIKQEIPKYDQLYLLLNPFKENIQILYDNLEKILSDFLNQKYFEKFENEFNNYVVEKLQKNEIKNLIANFSGEIKNEMNIGSEDNLKCPNANNYMKNPFLSVQQKENVSNFNSNKNNNKISCEDINGFKKTQNDIDHPLTFQNNNSQNEKVIISLFGGYKRDSDFDKFVEKTKNMNNSMGIGDFTGTENNINSNLFMNNNNKFLNK